MSIKKNKRPPIGTIESSRENIKISRSSSSSSDDCNLIVVISAYITPHNAPNNRTLPAIHISEHSKYYSTHNLIITAHVTR